MTSPKFIFVAGVPGSGWSMISHRLRLLIGGDTSDHDYSDDKKRTFKFQRHDGSDLQMKSHHGCYFGPDNEFGEKFDDIVNNYSLDEFVSACQVPFSDDDKPVKLIRSHWFSYQLDWLWDNFKGHELLLIHKEDDASFQHWIRRGGFNITHPVYTWYQDETNMQEAVAVENASILDFSTRKQLIWDNYTEEWWVERFGEHNHYHKNRPREDELNNGTRVIYTTIT